LIIDGEGDRSCQGSGALLGLPPLPLTPPVRVQLHNSDSATCWEASYESATRNDGRLFKADGSIGEQLPKSTKLTRMFFDWASALTLPERAESCALASVQTKSWPPGSIGPRRPASRPSPAPGNRDLEERS